MVWVRVCDERWCVVGDDVWWVMMCVVGDDVCCGWWCVMMCGEWWCVVGEGGGGITSPVPGEPSTSQAGTSAHITAGPAGWRWEESREKEERKAAILLEVLLPIPLQFSGLHYWQCRVVEQCMRSTTVIYHLNGLDNSSGGARLSSYWIFGKDALDITRVIKIIIFITQTQCQPQHNLS